MQMHPSWMTQLVHESKEFCTHERHGPLHHNIQELHGLNILPSDVMSTLEHLFFGPQVMLSWQAVMCLAVFGVAVACPGSSQNIALHSSCF